MVIYKKKGVLVAIYLIHTGSYNLVIITTFNAYTYDSKWWNSVASNHNKKKQLVVMVTRELLGYYTAKIYNRQKNDCYCDGKEVCLVVKVT